MDTRWLVSVVVGGTAGALVRWGAIGVFGPTDGFPWAVLAVNLVGCALLGAVLAIARRRPRAECWPPTSSGSGSAAGSRPCRRSPADAMRLNEERRSWLALGYAVLTVALCVAAGWLGLGIV